MVVATLAAMPNSCGQRHRQAESLVPALVFTPKHGSWLNLVEGFFSKMARSVLRRIRVASKNELKARILAYLDDLNREPVIHTWTYKIDTAA
jgi:transposase